MAYDEGLIDPAVPQARPQVEFEDMAAPFPWSEDMGVFTDAATSGGVLFGIGAGVDHPALHSETYDFPDALLGVGIDLWTRIAVEALSPRSFSYNASRG